jgi:hypothetical protein
MSTTAAPKVSNTTHIGADKFLAWLDKAKAGDSIIYATGDVLFDRRMDSGLSKLANEAYRASTIGPIDEVTPSGSGLVHLTQRRIAPFVFEYRAQMRRRQRK